jgi:hypothetical protein
MVDVGCIQNFCCKPEGKISFETPRCRWEDNIITDLEEIG